MPTLAKKNLCTGCAACYSSCNFDAINMVQNLKDGFLYPVINDNKCKGCLKCEKACPVLSKMETPAIETPYACVAFNRNSQIRMQSTSGGVFTALAETILEKGGVVFGAAMTDDFHVKHIYVERKQDLGKFRNSKYVQSEIGETFRQCKKFLDNNRWVCFSGTPCQIKGLIFYLGKEYKNLVTIDVMCHSVPSPLIFQKYIGYQKSKGRSFDTVIFRDKKRGYSYSNMVLSNKGMEVFRAGSELDPWFRCFLHAHADRLSCFECRAQIEARVCDITLWDCWKIKELAPQFDDNKGATNCVIWTNLGKRIFREASPKLKITTVDSDALTNSLSRTKSEPRDNRDIFFSDANQMSDADFIRKYFPESMKVKIKSLLRSVLLRLKLHDAIRDIAHKLK